MTADISGIGDSLFSVLLFQRRFYKTQLKILQKNYISRTVRPQKFLKEFFHVK